MRTALKGSLATLDRGTGHPYASLVLIATEPDGSPILLISRLARHTRNLEADARASILLDATDGMGAPLEGGRLTLIGEARPTGDPGCLARFVARHPSAEAYAGFTDFSVYRLTVNTGHYIGGFGKIVDLAASELLTTVVDAKSLIDAEAEIVAHMNSDHSEVVSLYASELAACRPGTWRISGIDPEGVDLQLGTAVARLVFPNKITTPAEARDALIEMAQKARARKGEGIE